MFYDRLFQTAPELRPMFKTSIESQARKFIDTLSLAIGLLLHEQFLTRTLAGLGQRHTAYGARPEHYALVGEAMIWTIEQALGDACTPEIRDAWIVLYDKAASIMTGQGRLQAA